MIHTSCTLPTILLVLTSLFIHTVLCGSKSGGIFLNRKAFLSKNIDETTRVLANQMKVACTKDGIYVTFKRENIMSLGVIIPSQLHLIDHRCTSTANGTHFTLRTGFVGCNTTISISRNNTLATIKNTVIISPPDKFFADDTQAEPVDNGNRPVEIGFTCTYSDGSSDEPPDPPSPPDHDSTSVINTEIESATMKMYSTDSYAREVDLPKDITRGTSLYVKLTALNADRKEVNFFIDSCYLSSRKDSEVTASTYYLIEKGCPVDRDVQFKEDSSQPPRKFLFRARKQYGNKLTYLYCTLAHCSGNADRQCHQTQQSYCNTRQEEQPETIFHISLANGMRVVKRRRAKPPTTTNVKPEPIPIRTTATNTIYKQPINDQPRNCPPSEPAPVCKCPAQTSAATNTQTPKSKTGMVSIEVTVVVAVLSFAIGAAFIAILWCVYIKTDSRRNMQPVSMSSDEGLSSRESTVPTEKLMKPISDITSSEESH